MEEAFDVRKPRSWRFNVMIFESTRKLLSISRNSGNSKNFDKPCIGHQMIAEHFNLEFQFKILGIKNVRD